MGVVYLGVRWVWFISGQVRWVWFISGQVRWVWYISGQLNLGLQSHLEGDTEGTSPLYHNPFTCMAPNSSVDTLPSASLILASSPKKASYWDFFFVAANFVHTGMLVFQQFSSTACFFFGGGGGGGGGGGEGIS